MARKKKKKQIKKLKSQQRRAVIARKRKKRNVTKIAPKAEAPLLDDMLPLFPYIGESTNPDRVLEEFFLAVVDSAPLADEPEFIDFLFDPMEAAVTFIKIADEQDFDFDAIDDLPEDEQQDMHLDLNEAVTTILFTDEFRRDVLKRLNKMRKRLQKSRHKDMLAQVAALQLMLQDNDKAEKYRDLWPTIGLLMAITNRSISAGFSLSEIQIEGLEALSDLDNGMAITPDNEESPGSLFERIGQTGIIKKAEGLLNKIPGVDKFLNKQLDQIWEEAEAAMFDGALRLNIYSEAELEAAAKIMRDVLGTHDDDEPHSDADQDVTAETGQEIVTRQMAYVNELFTTARLEALQKHIRSLLNSPTIDKKWTAFLYMLDREFEADDALQYNQGLLAKALFAELRWSKFEQEGEDVVEEAERSLPGEVVDN